MLSSLLEQTKINEDYHKGIKKWLEHPIHQAHKGFRCISQPKRYHQKFKIPTTSPEPRFGYIFQPNF